MQDLAAELRAEGSTGGGRTDREAQRQSRYITEMTNGDGDERFEFGLDVLISGLAAVSEKYR